MHLRRLCLLAVPFLPLLARADVTATLEETRPLTARGEVVVDNINGPVRVETWDQPEVRLVAVKSARTEADLAALEIQIDSTETRFGVKSVYGDKDGSWLKKFTNTGEVRYTLTVPHTATLRRIETMNGPIEIANAHGRVTAKSMNGRVEARGLRDEAQLSSVNGGVEASFDSVVPRQDIVLETVNGGIVLHLPAEAGVELTASTVNGSITNDFGPAPRSERWIGEKLETTIGDGSARVRLKTTNGAVVIRRR